jgi:hypothetical protein
MKKNIREIHSIPTSDRKFKHKVNTRCSCEPTVETVNNKLIVQHNKMGRGRDLWKVRFGMNGKEITPEKFFEGTNPEKLKEIFKEFQKMGLVKE